MNLFSRLIFVIRTIELKQERKRISLLFTFSFLRKDSTLKSSFINANLTKTEKRELEKALKELQKQEIVNEDGETVNQYEEASYEISANEELILDTMTCAGTDFCTDKPS